jgi:RHS repeat-associated protein
VDVNLCGALANGQPVWTPFVTGIAYDAKGQRTLIQYGNGAAAAYSYDPKTFRLTNLKTRRPVGLNGFASQIFNDPATVQNLSYDYDPVGNITRIADAALKTVFNANQQIDSASDYIYDPLYRLIQATGREHIGQSAFAFSPPNGNYRDYPFVGATQQSDLQALRNYTELYAYDPVGNFLTMAHQAVNGNWTRGYAYNEASLTEPGKQSNRLSQTALQTNANPPVETYAYDAHGNITRMPHLPMMRWNFKDELSASSRQVVNGAAAVTTYYVYDAVGQRGRKVTEGQDGAKNERFYVDRFEIYREYGSGGSSPTLERQTLHVMDDKQRIASVESQILGAGASRTPAQRYNLGDHLDSTTLELDEGGGLIFYEEYSSYGRTAYQAGGIATEVSLKRYRYTGKERDSENGFTYHGMRYYALWLGRWTSCDLAGFVDGPNLYGYARSCPVRLVDKTGLQSHPPRRVTHASDDVNGVPQSSLQPALGAPNDNETHSPYVTSEHSGPITDPPAPRPRPHTPAHPKPKGPITIAPVTIVGQPPTGPITIDPVTIVGHPPEPPPTTEQGRINYATRFLEDQGWTRAQAVGVVANLQAESHLDPALPQQGGGPGYGIAQWGDYRQNARQAEFARLAGHDIRGSSFDEQLIFVQHELTHGFRGAGRALHQAGDAATAAETVTRRYEIPKNMQRDVAIRRGYADRIFRGPAP